MKYPNLKAEIARSGVSIDELATIIGVHPNTIRNWLSDRATPTVDSAFAASDYFDVDVRYLFATEAITPSA